VLLMAALTGRQIADEGLTGWAYLLGGLQTRLHTATFAAGAALAVAVAEVAGERLHADLRPTHVDIRVPGPVTPAEIGLARTISALATERAVSMDATSVSRLELALDTPARESVRPFWAAVLAMTAADDEVRDEADSLPTVWFQESGSDEPRQRWHPDVWVDPAQVKPRIAAAVAAGGTLVSDAEAPNFWVLADAEGNKVCLCTWQNRD
jgi:4a-hydroxytetrahydrobiopterin dehydratase